MNKKGVSALIATVLIVGITIAAFGIIYNFIIPVLKEMSEGDKGCSKAQSLTDAQLLINTEKGFTCFDQAGSKVLVQISRGPEEFNLTGIQIKIKGAGTSQIIEARDGYATDKIRTGSSKVKLGNVWWYNDIMCLRPAFYDNNGAVGNWIAQKNSALDACKAVYSTAIEAVSTGISGIKTGFCYNSFTHIYYDAKPTKYDCMKEVGVLSLPSAGEDETFIINTAAAGIISPEFVSVAPIVKTTGKEDICDMGLETEIPECE